MQTAAPFSEYWHKAQRKLFGSLTLADIAESRDVIHPGNWFDHPSAIYLPEELNRITGVGLGGSIEGELKRMQAHRQFHQASIAYHTSNLLACNGDIYGKRFKYGIKRKRQEWLNLQAAEVVEQPVIVSQTWLGSQFFGHFISDDIPLNLLAQTIGNAYGISINLTEQQQEYAKLFQVRQQQLPEKSLLKQVTLFDDFHYNEHKVVRWKQLRKTLTQHKQTPKHQGVFLMRGHTGAARLLVNEQEVADYLSTQGFLCINPGESHLNDVIDAVAHTDRLVGVEGSQLIHGFLGLREGGSMLILQPPMQFSCVFKDKADMLNIRSAFHVCQQCEGGFKADLNSIKNLLNQMQ